MNLTNRYQHVYITNIDWDLLVWNGTGGITTEQILRRSCWPTVRMPNPSQLFVVQLCVVLDKFTTGNA